MWKCIWGEYVSQKCHHANLCFPSLFRWNMTQMCFHEGFTLKPFEQDTPIWLRHAPLKWQAVLKTRVMYVDIHRCVCTFDRNMHLHLFTDPSHKHTHTLSHFQTSFTQTHTHTSLSDGVLKWHVWMTTPLKNLP